MGRARERGGLLAPNLFLHGTSTTNRTPVIDNSSTELTPWLNCEASMTSDIFSPLFPRAWFSLRFGSLSGYITFSILRVFLDVWGCFLCAYHPVSHNWLATLVHSILELPRCLFSCLSLLRYAVRFFTLPGAF